MLQENDGKIHSFDACQGHVLKLPKPGPMRILPLVPILAIFLASCGGNGGKSAAPPTVEVAPVGTYRFIDRIDAVGTAVANEQVTLSAPVTQRLVRVNFEDGGFVQAGQVIATLAQGQELAQLQNAQARSREAEQQLDRLQALRERGFATKAALDTQVALAASANADAAEARASIGDRVIRAPFSGWVSLRNISQGAVIQAGTEIAVVSDLSRIKLDFSVPETLLGALRVGQRIDAKAAAYPERTFEGQISSIDPTVDPATRAVKVRALLANPERLLKPGMLLTVGVRSAERQAPAIPELAVVGDGDQRYVYALEAENKVKRMSFQAGARQDGLIEVRQGIKPGARVVVEGVVKLSDGMTVQLPSAQASSGEPSSGKAPTGG
jgi:membrane fusion protein (multidrug efflux system)